jgi:predicted AlkP superfamily pyrophosphatase or phosphodiesterase
MTYPRIPLVLQQAMRPVFFVAAMGLAVVVAPPARAQAPARPTLVVFITVDQLRPDYLERWDAQFIGGFRRLIDESTFFTRGLQDHAITETAPGHASTLSGRFPVHTGIASNSAGVNTREFPLVGGDGPGAAPFRFIGTTLADWMIRADARSKVLSVSRKDRGAILPVGRGKHPVFWYSSQSGNFVTSRWYADSLPSWVSAFNAEDRVLTRYAGREWNLLLPESSYPEADSVPAESGGEGFLFPHELSSDPFVAKSAIGGYPWMDEFTLDFALRGVRELGLGAGPQTDLLAVSVSTTDAIGHRFGPDSRELHDQILRLDRALGAFIDSVVALRGAENVVIALSSDHGVAPVPEIRSTWGDNQGAMRLPRDAFQRAFANIAHIVDNANIPFDAFTFDWPTFEVDRSKAVGKERQLRTIARAFADQAKRVPGVMRADVIDDLNLVDTTRDATARRWLHMFERGGPVLVALTMDPFSYPGTGIASHGSPHDYDARVPIMFWGTPFRAQRDSSVARVVDIAPTLAQMLGVPPTERLDGIVLDRAFKPRR